MATNIDTACEIYSQRFLKGLVRALPRLRVFSNSFTDEAREVGEVIRVPLVSADTVAAWNATSNNFQRSSASLVDVKVDLNTRLIAGFAITSEQMVNFRPNWWEGKAERNAKNVCDTMIAAFVALVTPGNYGDTAADKLGVKLASFNRKALGPIRAAAVAKKLVPEDCALCLSPDFYSALLNDLDALVYGGREAIVGGVIPGLLGFANIVEVPQLTIPGFVCHPDAIAVATRKIALADTSVYKLVTEVTEPETGLTMTEVVYPHGPDGSLNHSVNAAYGASVGNKDAMLRLVDA